jgi:hypothetical protein
MAAMPQLQSSCCAAGSAELPASTSTFGSTPHVARKGSFQTNLDFIPSIKVVKVKKKNHTSQKSLKKKI